MSDWANLLLRWLHLFSGILWIGQTWLFMWLDRRLEDALENPGGQLYMVHSGGFYVVEKRPGLASMPKTLHWFKWEAALTWATGIALLVVVYYMGGLLQEPDAELSQGVGDRDRPRAPARGLDRLRHAVSLRAHARRARPCRSS